MEQGDIVSNERPSKAVLRAVEAVQANIDTVVESMMEAYRAHIPSYRAADPDLLVGAHRFWEHLVDLAPESPEERLEVLSEGTRTMLELLETAVAAVSAGYQETAEELVADEEHDVQALIEVLAGVREADEQLGERARRRGVELPALRWCVAVDVGEQEVGALVRSLRRAMPEAIVGRVGGAVVSYLPGDEAPEPPRPQDDQREVAEIERAL